MSTEKRNISVYLALNGQDVDADVGVIKTPSHNIPTPTEDDYITGKITRYFVKKINNDFAYETSEVDYTDVDGKVWQKVELEWMISGQRYTQNQIEGIEPFNKTQTSIASVTIPEIKSVLTNPIQFARFS